MQAPTLSLISLPSIAFAFLLAASLDEATAKPQEQSSGFPLPIDKAWAGHEVRFDILTERGHQFVAYYDKDRRMMVAGRRLDGMEWEKIHPEGKHLPHRQRDSNVTGWDSHNYLELAMDRDGHIHLAGNMHNDPLIYYRTTRPFDITSLERIDFMTGKRENEVTYPVFFKNPAGDLLFRYRDGGSGRGSDIYNIYDPDAKTWRNLLDVPVIDGQGQRNAYALDPVLGPDGFFHLVWMWRDNPDCSTNHTLSYARSRDFLHWETSDGTPIELPITFGRGEVIDPTPIKGGLINMTFNLGFDDQDRPVVVYHRYDEGGKSQIFAARPTGPGMPWTVQQISDWDFRWNFSGWGSMNPEVVLGSPRWSPEENAILVDFVTMHTPASGRLKVDGKNLLPLASLPPAPDVLPPDEMSPAGDFPGLIVQTAVSRDSGTRWVLRWETLPIKQDEARETVPPPSELKLFRLPDGETSSARRIGS